MNPARLDASTDWRRFWWAGPPLLLALILFLVLRVTESGATPAPKLNDTVVQRYDVAPGTAVDVSNFAGNIRVQAGQEGHIVVNVRRLGGGKDADEAFDQLAALRVELGQEGGAVYVRTWYEGDPLPGTSAEVAISAPPGTPLRLETKQGSVNLAGMLGNIDASARGDIVVQLPGNARFTLNGGGNLKSEFRLNPDQDTGLYLANAASPASATQKLDLTALGGNVVLRRK